ncbi:MAG TPA: hypothetical protein VIK18_05675, partial [Pirellulales bacterium]
MVALPPQGRGSSEGPSSGAPADPLSALPANLQAAVRAYAARVCQVAGQRALNLSLLGAAAAGTLVPGRHLAHNALVLEAIELDLLRQLARELPQFQGIAPPLVFTPAYIRDSIDTFPLEFLEIQQQHVTVFGDDCFQPLVFEAKFVRLQCERELKSMVLALRQAVLSSAGDQRLLGQHPHAADGLLRVLRGLLWLKDLRDPLPVTRVVDEIQRIMARPLNGVRALLQA